MPLYPLSRGSDFSLLLVLARWSTLFHLFDPACLGMPFVCCLLLLKSYNMCYPLYHYVHQTSASSSTDHALLLGLSMATFIAYTRWDCCWLLGQGCFCLWLSYALSGNEPLLLWIDASSLIRFFTLLNLGSILGKLPLCNRSTSGAPALVSHSHYPLNFSGQSIVGASMVCIAAPELLSHTADKTPTGDPLLKLQEMDLSPLHQELHMQYSDSHIDPSCLCFLTTYFLS